jgi:hypothetical protein
MVATLSLGRTSRVLAETFDGDARNMTRIFAAILQAALLAVPGSTIRLMLVLCPVRTANAKRRRVASSSMRSWC